MKKNLWTTLLLIAILLAGLSLLLYPSVSDYWNSLHQTRAIVNYDEALETLPPEDYTSLFAAVDAYHKQLRTVSFPLMNYDQVDGYEDLLDISGSGMMGYLHIPAIDLKLPVYHGTDNAVLSNAVGHLEGTSLPIGGAGTHSVLSSHRGLPRAKLFTDLDQLEVGDTFTLTVLDRELTYQVDQILIVEPTDVAALSVVDGMDYCTLMTCTPYGINTHRLLVRGQRIETIEEETVTYVPADAVAIDPRIVAPMIAAPVLVLIFVGLMLPRPRRVRIKEESYDAEK